MDSMNSYVHGYSEHETRRLGDQADTLAALLHSGTAYPAGSRVLEVGCGVGAQTVHLVGSSPGAHLTAVDISDDSLALARARVAAHAPGAGVEFRRADLLDLPFPDASFDHLFVCFVLEHLPDPRLALSSLRRVLRPGGTLTVIEGDHESAFFHPASRYARAAIGHQVRLQSIAGGNALLGRQLQPLIAGAGYRDVTVRPRTVYADPSRPELVDGFTRNTFIAMIESVRDDALAAGLTTPADWDRGIADLHRAADDGGTFHYTFFKAVAVNPTAGPAFRSATDSDIPALVALIESAYRGDSSRTGWTTEADLLQGPRTDPDGVAAVIHGTGSRMIAVEADGRLVACCQLENRGGHAYFGMFAVRPGLQGGGLGKQILAEAERFAHQEWGADEMHMTVISAREDLIAYYVRRGYTRTGEMSPFPYGEERVGLPTRDDLRFELLVKELKGF